MPNAGSSASMAFQADGMKAQSSATLRTTRGFSASASNTGLARTRCSHTVVRASTNWVGTTTGTSRSGAPRATRCPKGCAATKARHSWSPSVASTGAMNMSQSGPGRPAARSVRPRLHSLNRLGPMALVVDLAVRRPPDGGDAAHPARRLVRGQAFLHVPDQLGLVGHRRPVRRLDPGPALLAVGRVWAAHHHGVAHRRVRLQSLLDLLGEDLLAA